MATKVPGQFKPTQAFLRKKEQLQDAVEQKVKQKLQDDLGKLFHSHEFSDFQLHVGSDILPVHSWILKARCRKFYEYCSSCCTETNNIVKFNNTSFEELEKCLFSLYTKDDIRDSLGQLHKIIAIDDKSKVLKSTSLSDDMIGLLEENTGDIDIMVEGKIIKVYKAILASRSEYFSAMFTNAWKENSVSSVTIPNTKYEVVMATMKYLYSAATDVDLFSSISDVLEITDMYGILDLQDIVITHLKITKCHLFHKPCTYCISQVYDCLKICEAFNLDLLKNQCIKWIVKDFVKTLNCKKFVTISEIIKNDIKIELQKQINESTSLDMWSKSRKLLQSVHNYQMQWVKELRDFCAVIQTSCINVTIDCFVTICKTPSILDAFLTDINYSSSLLELCFDTILSTLTVQNCCNVLQGFLDLIQMAKNPDFHDPFDAETFAVVEKSYEKCEKFVTGSIGQVTKTKSWQNIDDKKQIELKRKGFFVDL